MLHILSYTSELSWGHFILPAHKVFTQVGPVLPGWLPSCGQSSPTGSSIILQIPSVATGSYLCPRDGCLTLAMGGGFEEAKVHRNMSTWFWGSCQHTNSAMLGWFFQRHHLKKFLLMQHVIFSGSHLWDQKPRLGTRSTPWEWLSKMSNTEMMLLGQQGLQTWANEGKFGHGKRGPSTASRQSGGMQASLRGLEAWLQC